jgi:lipid A 3-O-deacylase
MGIVRRWLILPAAVEVAMGIWLSAAPAALAQTALFEEVPSPLIYEVRFGVLAHSIVGNNSEDGIDLNLELLFRRPAISYDSFLVDLALRPRLHLGASINTVGDTSQIYAGLTWDLRITERLSLEVAFGGAFHDGPTGAHLADSYGCVLNFRESLAPGYALSERWIVYGTVSHMSNADLCDHNTGLSSAGVRLGYKLE